MSTRIHDVIVVGAGNAALCAALAAREAGADVLVLEAAPEEEAGGNSRYTAGAFKFCYEGPEDIHALVPDLTEQERARTNFGSYTPERFYDDLFRVTRYRTDPGMADQLVTRSRDTMFWLQHQGVRFTPIWGRMAVRSPDGRFAFSGELVLDAWGGGQGLIAAELASATRAGIEIRYDHRAIGLLFDGAELSGVRVRTADAVIEIPARAIVLACGGFEANAEMRARYLGPGWELAKVRGTRFNTGEGIRMALENGAMSTGHWSGCHSVAWDSNAPPTGDLAIGDGFNKFSYPYGIMVNAEGRRFVDEGSDLRIRTYSKMGRAILAQPDGFAWQVFDAKAIPLLTDTYRMRGVAKVRAETLEELAEKMEGVNPAGFLEEIRRFNAAIRTDIPFDRQVTDGRRTQGLPVDKSNWAQAIEEGPFEAYQVSCGITFTFGGLATDPPTGRLLDVAQRPVPGLHAAGELVGGLFYYGYPGGAGLTAGAVFGRLAGESAARHALTSGAPTMDRAGGG
jgi:tricarballylate dehydrogenase